jgi:hypothetical protein
MMPRVLMPRVLFVLVMAAATTFFAGAPTARAADVTCSGTLGGGSTVTDINGNVTVPDNASCILNFVNVTGNVTTGRNSSLLITAYTEPSTIGDSPGTLGPLLYYNTSSPAPQALEPHVYPAFPAADASPPIPSSYGDQGLLETALLQACDALDGVSDGVVDNAPMCEATFNPTTATYVDYNGVFGPPNTTYPLQCTGAKDATCLSPQQGQTAIQIHSGPRTGTGAAIYVPAGVKPVSAVVGYSYDGGGATTVGMAPRKIGTSSPTSVPGDISLNGGQFPYSFWVENGNAPSTSPGKTFG